MEHLWQIDVGYACAGIISDGKKICRAAPIFGWMAGRTLAEACSWVQRKHGTVVRVGGETRMRLIFTSDWQVDFSNLQECETALEELLAAAAKYKPAAIIHAGDVKDAYSPVDVEVVKFCVRMVRRIRQAGYRFIILLGNHDRISQSAESRNWLDVLQAAGAEVVTRPKVKICAGAALAFLPYFGSQEALISASQGMIRAVEGYSGPKILVLHADISGAVSNASGRLASGPTPEDLGFDKYDAILSGHIHRHQRLGSYPAWYIGSPFCQDWGEADSAHGHVLVTLEQNEPTDASYEANWRVAVKQLVTKIPHWYNVEYLDKNKLTPEDGAYVRSKVPVTSKKISDQLRDEEERIRKQYGNVRTHIVPEIIDTQTPEVLLHGSTDREKFEQYVATTVPEEARFEPAQAVSYMVAKMDGLKEGATGGEIRFIGVEAENVLVFKKVTLKLAKLGLVVVRGENLDAGWEKRSNGSGKTALLSLLPIAMFGENTKGQKSDAWACEQNEDPAKIRLIIRDAAKRKIEVLRGRRPHSISLRIDGEDKSSGIVGTRKNETQGLIEQVTGYDKQMLMNAVYIDQAVANGFVFGTPSGRMDLISRFQNLERFEIGQKAVSADIKRCAEGIDAYTTQIDSLVEDIDSLGADLKELQSEKQSNWQAQLKAEQAVLDGLIDEHAAVLGVKQMYVELQAEIDAKQHRWDDLAVALRTARENGRVLEADIDRWTEMIEAGKCGSCGKPTTGSDKKVLQETEKKHTHAVSIATQIIAEQTQVRRDSSALLDKMAKYETATTDLERKLTRSRDRLASLRIAAEEEVERNRQAEERIVAKTDQLKWKRRIHRAAVGAWQALSIDLELLEYAKKAFHRTGIPLFMSMALCPLLNKAADDYSDVFTDGTLKVSFRVEDGEFMVDVVNPAGSATVDGQSVGEAAMAGIITAFSLREAAPKTNLLVMDEPGTGLDPEGCRQFARGILRLKDRFETILLVTHSAYITSLLSGETVYTVKKRQGRSRLFLQSQ